ncbi:MAG: DNA-binding protein, partial [Flavobacteriales bacterium]|nr:DNA-binding protein [Flavobacteriales bacterium]
MSRKIATPAAVFEACDQLDDSGKPWNRDDVRVAVGGGGFSVIDPLIQTWRKLKPVKALASSTPTTLLHQVAEALETHFSQHISDV